MKLEFLTSQVIVVSVWPSERHGVHHHDPADFPDEVGPVMTSASANVVGVGGMGHFRF